MKSLMPAAAVAMAALVSTPSFGQETLDAPQGEYQLLLRDSGARPNDTDRSAVTYDDLVHVEGAAWMRLHFGAVELSQGSAIRITSMLDGESQVLDSETLSMWSNASAFLNGDTVRVELIAAPRSQRNRVLIERALFETGGAHGGVAGFESCGICNGDDRVPSSEAWSGRLMPNGCTASIWNEASCLVSAGHCVSGNINTAVGFNVPLSQGNCATVQPPVADQFPLVKIEFLNAGVGSDWSVMTTGTNSLGETIYDRYGEFRPIATGPAPMGALLEVWGYGVDDAPFCYTQQNSGGMLNGVFANHFTHDVDTTFGNSGSAIIHDGEIVGIATHCQCPTNFAMRMDEANFAAAREAVCSPGPFNDDCSFATLITPGTFPYTTVDATTDGPNEDGSCGVTPQHDAWFRTFSQCNGELTITLSGSDFNVATTIYRDFVCPTGPDAATDCMVGDGTITLSVSVGDPVRIRIGSIDGSDGTGSLILACLPDDCPANCSGGDLRVDTTDLLDLLAQWGAPGTCDVDGSGVVDITDLLDLLAAWGPC